MENEESPLAAVLPALIVVLVIWFVLSSHMPHRSASNQVPPGTVSTSPSPAPHVCSDFVSRAADALDSNEGSGGFSKVNWDDNGYGISVGKLQWNQVGGELPGLLTRFHDANAALFNQVFGPYANSMLSDNYVRYQAHFSPDNELGHRMLDALAEPVFQAVQTEMMQERIIWAKKLARRYGHSSELFVVLVADIGNQLGTTGVENAMKEAGVASINEENGAISALEAASSRPGAARRNKALERDFSARTSVDSSECT